MKDLIKFLEEQGFVIFDDWNEEHCQTFTKYIDKVHFIYRLTIIDDEYEKCIRLEADAVNTHDRWANCDFTGIYKNKSNFYNNWYRYLEGYGVDYEI